jgi:hypothetical protein
VVDLLVHEYEVGFREGAASVNDRVVLKAGVALVSACEALRTMIPMGDHSTFY